MSVTVNRKAIPYNFTQKQHGGHISGSDARDISTGSLKMNGNSSQEKYATPTRDFFFVECTVT